MNCNKCSSNDITLIIEGNIEIQFCNDCGLIYRPQYECCSNQKKIRLRVEQKNGIVQRMGCSNCKYIFGTQLKRSIDFDKLPYVSIKRMQEIKDLQNRNNEIAMQKVKIYHSAFLERSKNKMREQYHEYRLTQKWKEKRLIVLERDNNLCQGCRKNKATEVHHLTYEHIGNEMLFELVSVCRSCHNLIHSIL